MGGLNFLFRQKKKITALSTVWVSLDFILASENRNPLQTVFYNIITKSIFNCKFLDCWTISSTRQEKQWHINLEEMRE